ncbi:mannitol-1-phosphate 5-dehydrogenase, partial [Citrobacter sp. TBCS-11]
VGKIFAYQDENDSQSVQLQEKLSTMDFQRLIEEVTGLSNKKIILEIELVIKKYKNDSK